MLEDRDPATLEVTEAPMQPPPLVGALMKNEQDMERLMEYLATRRTGRTW